MAATRTVSTCIPVKTQGSHVFRIFGYSQHKGIGVGKFIRSGAFSVDGHDWAIRFYPDGFSQGSSHCISVYLELLSKDAKSTGLASSLHKTDPRMFNENDSSKFAPQEGSFISRHVFEASANLRDDHMEIECVVTVMKDARVSETKPCPRIEVPQPDITAHLGKLLEAKEGADATFSVRGETFAAHKIVLAMRSPVFRAELYGPMRETAAELIQIEDMQPHVFRALLHFIYTDSLPDMDGLEGDDHREMIRHLLVAADRYAMDRLKVVCQSILSEKIDVQTVATTLALADQHNCHMLKDACLEFINSSTMDDVASTQGFLDLKKTCPSVLVDVLLKMRTLSKS
ncbi:BTB/POZ and MATH domain-containing protein 2-like [Lolium rigidum]|uniref:BTB/POZ and MATH domain-containing protein 2-like n=1 Tax=Lolium rigidum TaxID=89674 RepID=UPI001F5D3AB3|nr:BTB/POZ and MATH domain-containing protein 2-like [Lolium rigidum]